jgi:hypothetical protein
MGGYHEFRSYSPIHDCEVVRLSVFDAHGREFFMTLPASAPRRYRERRTKALEAIDYAIEQKMEPGEVRVSEE